MKILKIESLKGYFLSEKGDYCLLEDLNKEEILHLCRKVLSVEEIEIDEFDKTKIPNQAHQIIYQNLSLKLLNLHGKREVFNDDIKRIYKDAYEKYII